MRKTSFGTMKTLLEKDGHSIAEHLTFDKEGRGHSHNTWEICYITEGQGIIFSGETEHHVKEGDVCKIPPNTNHWMKPEPYMEILLT
jgi:quercetin dioxygenase-like cupin family protein